MHSSKSYARVRTLLYATAAVFPSTAATLPWVNRDTVVPSSTDVLCHELISWFGPDKPLCPRPNVDALLTFMVIYRPPERYILTIALSRKSANSLSQRYHSHHRTAKGSGLDPSQ